MRRRLPIALAVFLISVSGIAAAPRQPKLEFDHVWIVVSPNAPERAALERAGLQISPEVNRHDGQGTASITIEFGNAFLELMWPDSTVAVAPGMERGAEKLRKRMLWRTSGWCPFGLRFRRTAGWDQAWPFPTWSFSAPWMGNETTEMLTPRDDAQSPSLSVSRGTDQREQAARAALYRHPLGVHKITGVALIAPKAYKPIPPLTFVQAEAAVDVAQGEEWALVLTFDGGKKKKSKDLRPDLPLVIHY